jgi:toxin FitB
MSTLLDTCVLSEFTHRKPELKVAAWLDAAVNEELFLSAITIGEIKDGIDRLPESQRKSELLVWLNDGLIKRFGQRILPIDIQTMLVWGSLRARLAKLGQPMPVLDSLIAATAIQHNLIIATRNLADFSACGVQLTNPWA